MEEQCGQWMMSAPVCHHPPLQIANTAQDEDDQDEPIELVVTILILRCRHSCMGGYEPAGPGSVFGNLHMVAGLQPDEEERDKRTHGARAPVPLVER
jgi:hypothetical protein